MRIKVLLVALFSISSLLLQAQEIKQYTVEEYNALSSDFTDTLDVLSPTNHSKNYFADEQGGFVIQFSQMDIGNSFDSLYLHVDSMSLRLFSLDPIVVTGMKEGDHAIKFKCNGPMPFAGDNEILFVLNDTRPFFENDAIVFGLLLAILAFIFWTSNLKQLNKFYSIVPALLLCYFIPAIFNSADIINSNVSELYSMAKYYLLPGALIMLCLSLDLKAVFKLGPKALIMFFTATIGIIIGGPIALWLVSIMFPDFMVAQEGEEIWRGLSTVAGSWIGGSANQNAMKDIYQVGDVIFSQMIIVDVFIANLFMAVLLFGISKRKRIDKWLKADNTHIDKLQDKMADYSASVSIIPSFKKVIIMLGVVFAVVGLAHLCADWLGPEFKAIIQSKYLSFLGSGFFWVIVLATLFGVFLSFTKAKKMEGVGASRIGTVFIYILVATIGMKMDIGMLISNFQVFFPLILIGLIWIIIHGIILFAVAKIIKAPFFFAAVGSQANVGGAASAPVVAGSFHPSLAPVGVLLAVLGYAVGTIGAIICTSMMMGV